MKKIVITGIGMVTPVGNGKAASWSAIKAGTCGIGRITKFDASRCTCQVAGELKEGDRICLVGFGAGLTYGGILMNWPRV